MGQKKKQKKKKVPAGFGQLAAGDAKRAVSSTTPSAEVGLALPLEPLSVPAGFGQLAAGDDERAVVSTTSSAQVGLVLPLKPLPVPAGVGQVELDALASDAEGDQNVSTTPSVAAAVVHTPPIMGKQKCHTCEDVPTRQFPFQKCVA